MFTKTRIAPTPSGYLHLGNVFNFLITAALARQNKATILLRIDDLDQSRTKRKYIEDIFTTLRFLEIPWDEGPTDILDFQKNWTQHNRISLYQDTLNSLVIKNQLFSCNCSRKKVGRESRDLSYPGICLSKNLSLKEKDRNWRIKIAMGEVADVKQIGGTIIPSRLPPALQYFIVKKKDGLPAYQLASVIDDIYFGVDTIIRGKDLQSSTIAQILLADKIHHNQFKDTAFYHHPLIMASQHLKLSKSAGSTSIFYMRQHGVTKAAIYQEISRLLLLPELISDFNDFVQLFNRGIILNNNLILKK
ncbi:glutamate--tRNA ligase family protein [Anditalea andensis]|nr:glutamate--tRNA ligase family protein [Anditalea andensis]